MRRIVGLTLMLALAAAPAAAQGSRPYVGAQFRYWDFSDGNHLRDPLVYVMTGRWHAQAEYWDFRRGDDQVRAELGLHLRDARRSVYSVQYRAELKPDASDFNQHRFWVGTDQVLSDHVVGRAEVGTILSEAAPPEYVQTLGADYYWASWNFLSASAVHDTRAGGLWTYPLRLRLANEQNDWFQVTFAPASKRTVAWAVDVKARWLRLGIERNNRYDFTTRDNTIFTVGFEKALGPEP